MKICGNGYCEECEKECEVYVQAISWDYTAPNGRNAIHHEGSEFLSVCHDAHVYTSETLMVEFDNDDCVGDERY